jgi:hypothetical protein
VGTKTRKRKRDVPHARDREFRVGRGEKRTTAVKDRSNLVKTVGERVTIGGVKLPRVDGSNGSWPTHAVEPKRPPIMFLYDDLNDMDEPPPVFGMYPRLLITRILPWLRCERSQILHVCSGALPVGEGIRVDIRPEARPDLVADGRALPLADASVDAAMYDPRTPSSTPRTSTAPTTPAPRTCSQRLHAWCAQGGASPSSTTSRPTHRPAAGW